MSLAVLAGVLAVTVRIQARAALEAAVDAAAVAARQTETAINLTLRVRFATHTCAWEGPASPTLRCARTSGSVTVQVPSAADFFPATSFGFGPDPGWAQAAGCAGTRWVRPSVAGTWRICLRQSLARADPEPPERGAALAAAQQWLSANLAAQGLFAASAVTGLSVGAQGQVTVTADARLRWPVLGGRRLLASATAWPGR